jgi:hypothetical protein
LHISAEKQLTGEPLLRFLKYCGSLALMSAVIKLLMKACNPTLSKVWCQIVNFSLVTFMIFLESTGVAEIPKSMLVLKAPRKIRQSID